MFVQGFVGSSTVAAFTSTFAIPTDNSFVLESLTATPVNRLLFTLVDAQGRPNPAGGSYIRLDDVTFGPAGPPPLTTTPEPGTWAMLAAGLVPLGATVRARRRA